MNRRQAAALCASALAALAACSALRSRALIPIPPERFGAWTRFGLDSPDVATAPAPAPVTWIRAAYFRGNLGVQVNAFGYDSESARVEAASSLEHDSEAVSFARPLVLVVCRSQTLDHGSLTEFARELESAWLAPRSSR